MYRTLIIIVIIVALPILLTAQAAEDNNSQQMKDYDIYKEKMLPKCLEFKEAGSLDMLKNHDTNLWLMCLEFIIDGKN